MRVRVRVRALQCRRRMSACALWACVRGRQQGVVESTLRHDSPAADRQRPNVSGGLRVSACMRPLIAIISIVTNPLGYDANGESDIC